MTYLKVFVDRLIVCVLLLIGLSFFALSCQHESPDSTQSGIEQMEETDEQNDEIIRAQISPQPPQSLDVDDEGVARQEDTDEAPTFNVENVNFSNPRSRRVNSIELPRNRAQENNEQYIRIEEGKQYYIVNDDILFLTGTVDPRMYTSTGIVNDDILFLRMDLNDAVSFRRDQMLIRPGALWLKSANVSPTDDTNSEEEEEEEDQEIDPTEEDDIIPQGPLAAQMEEHTIEVDLNFSTILLNTRELTIFGFQNDSEGGRRRGIWSFKLEELHSMKLITNTSNTKKLKIYLKPIRN